MKTILRNRNVEFTLIDRLGIITSLPSVGSALMLKTSRDIVDKLAPTEKELKDYEIIESDGKIRWNDDGDSSVVDFEITDSESGLIWSLLKELDAKEELSFQMLSLYEKFDPS